LVVVFGQRIPTGLLIPTEADYIQTASGNKALMGAWMSEAAIHAFQDWGYPGLVNP